VIERVNANVKALQTEFGAFVEWVLCSETMSIFSEDLLLSEIDEWFKKTPPVDPEAKVIVFDTGSPVKRNSGRTDAPPRKEDETSTAYVPTNSRLIDDSGASATREYAGGSRNKRHQPKSSSTEAKSANSKQTSSHSDSEVNL